MLVISLIVLRVFSGARASDIVGFPQLAGPIHFIYHAISDCTESPTPINLTVRIRWLNATSQVLDGNVLTPVPIGDNLSVKVAAYALVVDKWVLVTNVSGKVCQILRNYVGPSKIALLASVGLSGDTCPIPKGVYHGRNVHFDMKESRVPAFPYGKFRLRMALNNIADGALQLCTVIHLENLPM